MADRGLPQPFDRRGLEFDLSSTESWRCGAGRVSGKLLGFRAVCDSCKGLTVWLLARNGKLIQQAQSPAHAVRTDLAPEMSVKGSIGFAVTNCPTRDDRVKVRDTWFTQ